MRREEQIAQQMQELGVYAPAFADSIHALAVLERELSRARKAWAATAPRGQAPSVLDPHYEVICKQRREIAALRETLGLTPKGLTRLRRAVGGDGTQSAAHPVAEALDALLASVSNSDTVGDP